MTSFVHSSSITDSNKPKNKILTLTAFIPFIIICLSVLTRLFYLGQNSLLGEEAYYWNYAQHLDFGYLDHPPMVALLIKTTTSIVGMHEFGVRISSLICWLITAFFSFKLSNLIERNTGFYAIFLLAILPYFFLLSLVITPDQPLIVCWSAALYYLYRALILDEAKLWYTAGIWIGLGLLSKYTISLLGPAILVYLIIVPTSRHWWTRKEPYIGALISLIIFSPVIYWNATHEWASFIFQSTRRMNAHDSFSFHHFIGLILFFLMPLGIVSLWLLLKNTPFQTDNLNKTKQRFLQLFTIVPLGFLGIFSLTHQIKFNWIGPGLLAFIPWLAIHLHRVKVFRNLWIVTALVLLLSYNLMLFVISYGYPTIIYNPLFTKFIDWNDLTHQVNDLAHKIELKTNTTPIIIPLYLYATSSEFTYYQKALINQGIIQKVYPVEGVHILGGESLMYRYWSKEQDLRDKPLIIISNDLLHFNFQKPVIKKSPIKIIWAHSPVQGKAAQAYYYQIVQLKS